MDATTTGTIVSDYVDTIGTLLSNNLPAVLVVAAALFGLGLLIRKSKSFIK